MLDSVDWETQMNAICSTAGFLFSCNVLDLAFTSGETWEVYVAASSEERRRGLSEVAELDLSGMLFVYERPSYVPFTMKAMMIGLDIAWYDERGKLLKKGSYSPSNAAPICCPRPFSYVLEANMNTIPESDLVISYG